MAAVAARAGRRAALWRRFWKRTPPEQTRTTLPEPRAILEAQALTVAAPGAKAPAVRGASFRLEPGQAVGIAGPSASGKSTLARALAGVWRPIGGTVRLDGAALDQYGQTLGQHIGYLPQEVVLFEGTVAENIARFSPAARDEDVVEAAKRTGAHEMILRLPGGYDLQVSAGGAALSGGQRQRIALARAFYGSPVVVVLDEPDSNLDAVGTMALARAVQGHKGAGRRGDHRRPSPERVRAVRPGLSDGGRAPGACRTKPQGAGAAPAGSGKREEEERPSARSLAGPR